MPKFIKRYWKIEGSFYRHFVLITKPAPKYNYQKVSLTVNKISCSLFPGEVQLEFGANQLMDGDGGGEGEDVVASQPQQLHL
jgi:hypothetical protein